MIAAARLARHLELALATVDLTLPQFRLLTLLANEPGVANQLARDTQVRPPSLTALVSGLADRGLMVREPDPDDRRRVRLAITDAGLAAIELGVDTTAARLRELDSLVVDPSDSPSSDSGTDAIATHDRFAALSMWGAPLDAWRSAQTS